LLDKAKKVLFLLLQVLILFAIWEQCHSMNALTLFYI